MVLLKEHLVLISVLLSCFVRSLLNCLLFGFRRYVITQVFPSGHLRSPSVARRDSLFRNRSPARNPSPSDERLGSTQHPKQERPLSRRVRVVFYVKPETGAAVPLAGGGK